MKEHNEKDWLVSTGSVYDHYSDRNYSGLSGVLFKAGHRLLEKNLPNRKYSQVLELGAGPNSHYPYLSHDFDSFIISDFNPKNSTDHEVIVQKDSRVRFEVLNAAKPHHPQGSFDRIIASQLLEHIPRPMEVIVEWMNLLAPGGVLSIGLPCDPGILWRFSRWCRTLNLNKSERISYNYIMANEHINSITTLLYIADYHCKDAKHAWWPLPFATTDFNLFCGIQIFKK